MALSYPEGAFLLDLVIEEKRDVKEMLKLLVWVICPTPTPFYEMGNTARAWALGDRDKGLDVGFEISLGHCHLLLYRLHHHISMSGFGKKFKSKTNLEKQCRFVWKFHWEDSVTYRISRINTSLKSFLHIALSLNLRSLLHFFHHFLPLP